MSTILFRAYIYIYIYIYTYMIDRLEPEYMICSVPRGQSMGGADVSYKQMEPKSSSQFRLSTRSHWDICWVLSHGG